LKRSGEEAVEQLLALLGIRDLDTNINLPNTGQMPGVPLGAVVETNSTMRENEIRPVVGAPLPSALESAVLRVVRNQMLTLEASFSEDRDLAFQAILGDPLVNLPVCDAEAMFDELLKANRTMLPSAFIR
jgi:alpha-galactosidase